MAFKRRGELQGGELPQLWPEGDEAQSEVLLSGR